MSDLDTVRKLRLLCGASITGCKKALDESGGDFNKALEILKRKGVEFAAKKSQRETRAGVVDAYIHSDRKLGVLIEVRTETDFVSRNPEFRTFVHDLAMQAAAMEAEKIEDLMGQPFIKDQSKTVGDYLKEIISKFGENVEIAKFYRITL
ncbi:MAG: translation elongation factor Ts [Candidatus Niyogibacteria bacterium]|nr:MAG: translation elongation factor Ts [Candidatus Niyogibacteria bacterium]